MQRKFERMHIRFALRRGLIALVVALLGTAPLWAHPEKGTPAPPLDTLKLLQAPLGARADWEGLKGKVVVLEFWATWCSPCVASLPHLNQLVESLDPAKFQFISIDDQGLKAVQTFLPGRRCLVGLASMLQAASLICMESNRGRRPSSSMETGRLFRLTEIESVSAADLKQWQQEKT